MIEEQAYVAFKEKELSDLLENLPEDFYLRERLQKAGKFIFNW